MIAEVFADAGQLVHDRRTEGLQQRAWSDAGELQQPRRVDRAAAQDDFAPRPYLVRAAGRIAAHVTHTNRALPFEDHRRGGRLGTHFEVAALARRPQKRARRGLPPAVQDVALVVADAFLARAVVVRVARNPHRLGAGDEGLADRVDPIHVGDRHLALAAAEPIVAGADLALGALEVRQHLGEAPAAVAGCRPSVVVGRQPAVVDQAVDRGRTAKRAPHWNRDAAALGVLARFRGKLPGEGGIEQNLDEAGRNVQERVPVPGPRLQQADRCAFVFREPVGEYRTRRPGAHDHVVENFCGRAAVAIRHDGLDRCLTNSGGFLRAARTGVTCTRRSARERTRSGRSRAVRSWSSCPMPRPASSGTTAGPVPGSRRCRRSPRRN